MDNKFMVGVKYLEGPDINPDGSLKANVGKGKPVILMVYGLFCPHCKKMMPIFPSLIPLLPNVVVAAVQTDGGPEDKKAAQMLSAVNKSPGVPSFLGFNRDGKFVKMHEGGRDVDSLKKFAQSL